MGNVLLTAKALAHRPARFYRETHRSCEGWVNLNLSAVHEKIRSRAYGQRFRNWFRVKASGSIGPMCSSRAQLPAPRPSSAMSPAGYSLAVLSSNRLRFADRLQWWGSFRLTSTGKTSQPSAGGPPLPSSKPAEMRAFYSGTDTELVSSPCQHRTWRADFPHYAPCTTSHQGLWGRSDWSDCRDPAFPAATSAPARLVQMEPNPRL